MKHIMVDLETWGTAPGCDIRSIGAVVFDPVAGTLGDEFYVNVENPAGRWCQGEFRPDLAKGINERLYPLLRERSTIAWWAQQSEAAQQRLTTDVVDLADGLGRFQAWWGRHDDGQDTATFWAHGPHFDEAILAACYRATGLVVPWHYRAPRDCRTAFEMAGDPCHVEFEGVEHHALADAKNQALRVIEAYRRVRVPINRVAQLEKENAALNAFITAPPKHVFWMAGEPDCPVDIKASNGEIHTLRCKNCGSEAIRDNVCRATLGEAA